MSHTTLHVSLLLILWQFKQEIKLSWESKSMFQTKLAYIRLFFFSNSICNYSHMTKQVYKSKYYQQFFTHLASMNPEVPEAIQILASQSLPIAENYFIFRITWIWMQKKIHDVNNFSWDIKTIRYWQNNVRSWVTFKTLSQIFFRQI